MTNRKFKFNKRQIDAIPPTPPDSRSRETEYTDDGCSGLKLIVNRQGRKRYLFRYSINGTKKSLQIGEYPAIEVTLARQIANEHKMQLALGNDPKQLRDEKRNVLTFYEFAEEHYLPYARVNKLTVKNDSGNLRVHFYPRWKNKPINQITQHDIQKLLDELMIGRKPATVNRFRSLALRMFRLALEWGFIDKHPGIYIKKLKENNMRQRFLNKEEITAFINACDNEPSRTQGNILKLALLTGMRIGEIIRSKWEDLTVDDDGKGNLFLPHTKSGLSRTVLLNDLAMQVIEEQKQQVVNGNPHIFPGDAVGKPIAHPKKSFARIKQRAGGLEGLRIHDLRHSFASILINSGKATLYDVQHLLGHQSPQTTIRYAHIASSRLREVSSNVAEAVSEATKNTGDY